MTLHASLAEGTAMFLLFGVHVVEVGLEFGWDM